MSRNKRLKQWHKILLVLLLYLLIFPSLWSSVLITDWLLNIFQAKEASSGYAWAGIGVLLGLGLWWGLALWLRTKLKLQKEFDKVLEVVLKILWWTSLAFIYLCLGLGGFILVITLAGWGGFGWLLLGFLFCQLMNGKK